MNKSVEETTIATRTAESGELAPTASAAAVAAEVQAGMIVAKRYPRNEDLAYQKLLKACTRTAFAEDALYSYPRGGNTIEGPSVNLAREAARVWGNIEYGFVIVRDEKDERQLRGWAWDKETNTRNFSEASFQKLIQRKTKSGETRWVVPDEREQRELTNKHGAVLERNSILKSIPKDFIEDALLACRATLKKQTEQDPDGARKRIILAFSDLHITPEMLEQKLGHPLATCTAAELTELRSVHTALKDGTAKWSDYTDEERRANKPEQGTLKMDDLKATPDA